MEDNSESETEEDVNHNYALQVQFEELLAARLRPEEPRDYRQEFESHLRGLIDEEFETAINSMPDDNEQARSNQINLDAIIAEEINRVLRLENKQNDQGDLEDDSDLDDISFGHMFFDKTNESELGHEPGLEEEPRDIPDRFALMRQNLNTKIASIPISQEQDTFECSLCIEKHSLESSESFGCAHLYCKSCLANFFTSKVNDGDVLNIECPQEGCSNKASDNLIRSLLPSDKITKYDSFVFKRITDNLEDVMNCPECNKPFECDLATCHGICVHCNFVFCTCCGKMYHGTDDCPDISQRSQEVEKSLNFIRQNSKQCPGCSTNIEKDNIGCNHMTCAKCLTQFCWLCLTKLSTNEEEFERHFSRCVLFQHDFVD